MYHAFYREVTKNKKQKKGRKNWWVPLEVVDTLKKETLYAPYLMLGLRQLITKYSKTILVTLQEKHLMVSAS